MYKPFGACMFYTVMSQKNMGQCIAGGEKWGSA